MSGAEALAGIGILCNAMQIVTFGRDALEVYRHMRDGGAPDPNLSTYLDKAATSYKEMNERSGGPLPLTHDQQQVFDIGKEGYQNLQEFKRKFDKLYIDEASRGGIRGKLRFAKSGIKALWRAKDLEGVEKNFQRHEQLLQTRLIHRICSQADAAELLSHESFRHLKDIHQHMVTQLAKGYTDLSDLILKQSSEVKDHVTEQHAATRTYMVNHLATTEQNLQSRISESDFQIQLQKQHEQLLASLRYPDMNSRKNQVAENYPETFRWIFGVDDPSDARSNAKSLVGPPPFPTWLGSESKLFWISGKPASGKSTLMKFIASNPLTKESLESWRPGAQILVHYFWKAGHEMQQNIKGMILSLVHQLLLDKADLTGQLWEEKPFVRQRWAHSDWAPQELDDILCWTLQTAQNAFCIFIDGLDESSEFERILWLPNKSLGVLDRIMNLDGVKICLSSREEDVFCGCFEGIERLRIHELTENDIRSFANNKLRGLPFASKEDHTRLLDSVVYRAEGVFLWVALVLDSVTRGFRLDNDIESLIQRVEHTPADLKRLFQDMWERSGDDGDIYRVVASRYFNLAMAARLRGYPYHQFDSFISYAIASEDRTLESMLNADHEVTEMMLLARCMAMEREIRVVCHGLLEVVGSYDQDMPFQHGPECLTPYAGKKIQFIHRSAADFFGDTVLGSDLLSASGWSHDEPTARLLASLLIRGRLSPYGNSFQKDLIAIRTVESYVTHFKMFTCLRIMFYGIFADSFVTGPCRDLIIEAMRQWQFGRMLRDHVHWVYPGHPVFSPNPLELEYLESAAYGGGLPFVMRLLIDKPIETFLDAVPVIMRGLHYVIWDQLPSLNSFIEFVLNRFVGLDKEADFSWVVDTQKDRKHVIRLLYSWYVFKISPWFQRPSTGYRKHEQWKRFLLRYSLSTLKVLRLFADALSDAQDWDQRMTLHLVFRDDVWTMVSFHDMMPVWIDLGGAVSDYWSCFVIVNYGTAYHIVLDFVCELCGDLEPEFKSPKRAAFLFKPVLFMDTKAVYASRPDEQDRIGTLLYESVTTRSTVTGSEMSLVGGSERVNIIRDLKNVLTYLSNMLGNSEELPIHSWTPGWILQKRLLKEGDGEK